MSIRTLITTIAVAAALLAFPVVASARFSDVGPIDVHTKPQPAVVVADDPGSSGTQTTTVVLVAGLTLLAGAAMGFEGARLTSRRRALRPSAS
jgi:hypothetical protein